MSAWDRPKAVCPYCGNKECEADWCDVEVGYQQVGPYVCFECGASQIGPFDENELTEIERKTGWFESGHFGTTANTCQGQHVCHKTAKALYEMGVLDEKPVKKDSNPQSSLAE